MNTMEGAFSLASEKSWLTSFSDSPSHLETRSEEDTLKKVDSASVATALARYDFPVPGGPYKRMPLQGFLFPAVSTWYDQHGESTCGVSMHKLGDCSTSAVEKIDACRGRYL